MDRFWTLMSIVVIGSFAGTTVAQDEPPPLEKSAYAAPHNCYGAHLLVNDGKPGSRGDKNLRWARYLVGRWGFAKTLFGGIDKNTKGPNQAWIDYVNRCYELELIPLVRLAGHYKGKYWLKPEADEPGNYTSMAAAVKRVVSGLPRSDLCPLYVEVWNEPNLDVEWTGKTNHEEYAAFFVQVAKAIRSIGDDRIKILNGGLASSPEWARLLCQADPKFAQSFDYWSCHPYPMNRPPSFNLHDKKIPPDSELAIDSYLLELAELRKCGRDKVKVVITETGYDLGNSVYTRGKGHPIIDEYNRADYIMRAFRDYWSKWPEVHAVTPFEFCDRGWMRFDWVYPDSDINPDGSPSRPHYQYTVVAALAKPTDVTGAINGTVTVARLGTRLEGAEASLLGHHAESDPMGNYFLPKLRPGDYRIRVNKSGFKNAEAKLKVVRGQNTVFDIALVAERRADLTGVVRSGDTGKPIRGAVVRLSPGDLETKTNRKGEFEFKDCIPSRYTLTAEFKRHHDYRAEHVAVVSGRPNRHDFLLGSKRCPDAENLANNTSCEAGGGGGGKPGIALGFEPPALGGYRDGAALISDDIAHTGRRSQKMRVGQNEVVIRQISHYGTVEPGKRYLGGMWVKADCSNRESGAWITLDMTDNAGVVIERIEPKEKVLGRSDDWIWMQLEGVAPAGSQRLSINLHTQGEGGYAYFDDVYIGLAKE